MEWISDNRKIGVGLTGFGSIFLLLGVLLFGDRALLSLGNLLFLTGITLLIGTQKTVLFFFSRSKIRGSICFFVGIALVLLGYPIIGMLLEAFGVINLFGNFFPVVLEFLRRLPFCSTLLTLPVVSRVLDKLAGQSYVLPMYSNRD